MGVEVHNNNKLYISHEAVKVGLEIDDTTSFLEEHLPDLRKYTIYADNARPECISYMKRRGLSIKPVEKGKGSVEDGIAYMKSFDEIIIHPRCVHAKEEFLRYSYKVDPRSGDITRKIEEGYDHIMDAIRYSLERSMKRSRQPSAEQLRQARMNVRMQAQGMRY